MAEIVQSREGVRGVRSTWEGAQDNALEGRHHAHHHLLQVGTMIFGMPALADSLASLALEVERRGVEKHDVQIGEQVTVPREQRLLYEVLLGEIVRASR